MIHYRIYALDGHGRIIAGDDHMLPDDDAATEEADNILKSHPGVEVWSGTRRVSWLTQSAKPAFTFDESP